MTRAASPRGYQPGTRDVVASVDALLEDIRRRREALAADEADIRADRDDGTEHGDPAGCGEAGPW